MKIPKNFPVIFSGTFMDSIVLDAVTKLADEMRDYFSSDKTKVSKRKVPYGYKFCHAGSMGTCIGYRRR